MLEFIKNLFSNKKFLLIIFIIALFIGASIYVYYKYVVPRLNNVDNKEFNELTNADGSSQGLAGSSSVGGATFKFFYADWCPHSKKAFPIWNKLKAEFENKPINNTLVVFEEIDGESQPDIADQYNISGFPTFKLITQNQIIEYDAKPNFDTFKEFLHSAL